MEVEQQDSDSGNVAVAVESGVAAAGGGDATSSSSDKLRRRHKKYLRSNSKDAMPPPTPMPKYRSWKNSRRPRNGHGRGLPKKGGAGGKGVWGAVGSELLEELEEDSNDPNYDPEAICNGDVEFKQVIVEAEPGEVVRRSEPVILEYFEHGDTDAAAEELLDFVTAKQSHLVCETIVEIALDHKPSHCEMASVLISDLYGRIFTAKDIALAFENLLDKLPDLTLDAPEAATVLSHFIARCVADDCLPPKFVQSRLQCDLNPQAKLAVHRAETLLSMKQGLVRLDNIWGVGGGIRPVKFLIRQIQLLLKEYLTSGDLAEAARCVKELEVPHFHHELVYEVLTALSFFATGSYQKPIGMSFMHALSQPSVSNCVREVTMALNNTNILLRHIKFPQTHEERLSVVQGFSDKFGMPGILGCVDGTHVALVTPTEHEERFFNRKHYHSRNVQITILLALETVNTSVDEQLSTFLAELSRSVLVTPDQMDRGFLRVLEDMSDIMLDVPLAYIMLDRFVEKCSLKFRLSDHVLRRMPARGRKRFVSEGDGGAIKDHALKLRE